jgi:hypothetical protein
MGIILKKVGGKVAKEDIVKYQFDKRTAEEQHEIAVAGGIASGKARQEKATFKKTLEMLLDEKNSKGKTYRELITLGQIKSAIDGKAENFKAILALMGEMEEQQAETPTVNINIVDNTNLESALYEESEKND